jgi:virginiamycin B lyase
LRPPVAIAVVVLALVGAVASDSASAAEAPAPSAFSLKAGPSGAAVVAYPMPRTLPTGGTGPLVVDPSGNVWFNETFEEDGEHHPGEIVRMNRAGEVTPILQKARAGDLAVAPDGAIWFTGFDKLGRIPPDGIAESFPIPRESESASGALFQTIDEDPIVVGREGDAWFSATRHLLDEEGKETGAEALIARMTPSGQLSEFVLPGGGGYPTRLAVGPDGNIWFTAAIANRVGYITPAGRIEEFPGLQPFASPNFITAGPDGQVWFTENEKGPVIARVATTGALSGFRIGGEKEYVGEGPLIAGPDGRVWFSAGAGLIGRIDPDGRISKIELPNQASFAEDLAVGPEGEVWYTSPAEPPCLTGDSVCGGAGYYQSGIVGRIAPAPLSVEAGSVKPARASRQVKVRINCLDGDATSVCHGRVRVRAAGAVGKPRSFAIDTDSSGTLFLALPSRARQKLLRRHHLAVRLEAKVSGAQSLAKRVSLRVRGKKATT